MSTSCAGLTDSAVLPIGCALRRREHVLFGKLAAGVACETDRFHIPAIRVCPAQEFGCGRARARVNMGFHPIPHHYYSGMVRREISRGGQRMGEHALSGKLTVNIACRADRLRCPAIRVPPFAKAVSRACVSMC